MGLGPLQSLCRSESPKLYSGKVGRGGHEQIGLVLHRDAYRSGVIGGIRVKRAGSYRWSVCESRCVGNSSAQRGLNRDCDSVTISKSRQVEARSSAGDRTVALRRTAGSEGYTSRWEIPKDDIFGIVWSGISQLDGVGKRIASHNLRC